MGPSILDAMDAIRNQFLRGERWDTPIILDLDGDGVETTGVKAGAYFDHAGDGFAEQTGWVGADDGLLVYDRNGNGTIDSGAELFGNNTMLANGSKAANGFEALKELDSNHDGKIDAQDAAFASLRVWKDADGDGYTSDGELLTLAEAGVQSINTGYSNSTLVDVNGNAHKQTGSYTTINGQTNSATDVWFKTDAMHTIANEWLDVPDDIAALPDLKGYGQVYDLHQAMVRDTSGQLKDLVSQFANATTAAERKELTQQIIYKWAGVDTLYGDAGNDTYIFNLGDGADTINNYDTAGIDTISFGAGIGLADINMATKVGNNLILRIGANGDQLTVNNWFKASACIADDGCQQKAI